MKASGTYKNELLKIISYFPILEVLKVLQISQNLMTNDDLIDLLTQSSCTLKKLMFVSRGAEKELKFGYDLRRRVCEATSNRSEINIEFEFDTPFNTKHFFITKESITEDRRLIVLRGSLNK